MNQRPTRSGPSPLRRLASGTTSFALSIGTLLASVPVALARAVRRRPAGTGGWDPASGSLQAERHRRFRSHSAGAGSGALAVVAVVGVVAAALVVAGGSAGDASNGGASGRADGSGPTGSRAPVQQRTIFAMEFDTTYSDLPAYEGVPWADDLQRAQQAPSSTPNPYVTVVDGVRRTTETTCDCPSVRIWWVGGSAAWGEGQRDAHTIPSELVRLAALDGIALEIDNIAEPGFVIEQERAKVVDRLASGAPRPDLVVVYDGWNDVLLDVGAAFAGRKPAPGASLSMSDLQAINDQPDRFLSSDIGPLAGRRAAERYREESEALEASLDAAGIDMVSFFQPDAFSSVQQMAGYEDLSGIAPEAFVTSPFAQAIDAAIARLGDRVVSLRHLFDDDPEPVFLGLIHQNEDGARAVAERIYEDLRPKLRSLAD